MVNFCSSKRLLKNRFHYRSTVSIDVGDIGALRRVSCTEAGVVSVTVLLIEKIKHFEALNGKKHLIIQKLYVISLISGSYLINTGLVGGSGLSDRSELRLIFCGGPSILSDPN